MYRCSSQRPFLRLLRGWLALFLLCCLCSCKQGTAPEVSFYYWKTKFDPSPEEIQALKNKGIHNLYVRYFDIDLSSKNQQAYPVSPIQLPEKDLPFEVIPVIYLKNQVFKSQDSSSLKALPEHIWDLIFDINEGSLPKEIQFDCDWTLSTRDSYFSFLQAFKKKYLGIISATIRLHQVKYLKKTGVPPVDKGLLMYYNMGTLNPDTENSIYERAVAKKYVDWLKYYPLPLNFALPIFAWGQQIREGKIIRLINKMNLIDYEIDSHFSLVSKREIAVKQSQFKSGYYFKKGDRIKLEFVTAKDLKTMAKDIKRNYPKKIDRVLFFDWDSVNLNRYEKDIFQKVAHRLR